MPQTPPDSLRLSSLIRLHSRMLAVIAMLCTITGFVPLAAQPTTPPQERVSVTEADQARIAEAAMLAETANAAGLDWKPYYLAFMKLERRKEWTDKEIQFIGMFFGAIQGRHAKELREKSYTDDEIRLLREKLDQETARLEAEAAALPPRKRSD